MTDQPILFSGPMVRAILREIEAPGGGKTQTRRILRPQPYDNARYSGVHYAWDEPPSWFFNSPSGPCKIRAAYDIDDRLWVRESGTLLRCATRNDPITGRDEWADCGWRYVDDADMYLRTVVSEPYFDAEIRRPSIHMPRWASRITLTVTEVRVQRLQDISEEDVLAEGIDEAILGELGQMGEWPDGSPAGIVYAHDSDEERRRFVSLWDSLNAHRGFGWAENPWVAAITFVPSLGNIDGDDNG